jgi:hypothetical protein
MARFPARVAPRLGALLLTALAASGACAAAAGAWTAPTAIYSNAAPQVLAVAGDPEGNAFAVYEGGSIDTPLLLSERSVTGAASDVMSLAWSAPRPVPGNVDLFTNSAPALSAATAAASGYGAGAIALRYGASLLTAVVRDPDYDFADPAVIAGGNVGRIDEPSVSISDNGTTLIAFHAAGGRSGDGRVLYSFRAPGGKFTPLNPLASSDGTAPYGAQADDGWPVLAWTNAKTAYVARIGDTGQATAPQRIGASRQRGPIVAAVGHGGDGVVSWIDTDGYLRLVRRSAPGAFSASLPIHRTKGAHMSDLAAAVDPLGRAFVTWLETQGTTKRVMLAQAPIGGSFTVTTLAKGTQIGRPVVSPRPDGGAAVAWPSPAGWQAVTTTKAKFGEISKVSAGLTGDDLEGAQAKLIAGPGLRVELVWRQLGDTEPNTGPIVFAASDSGT